MYTLTMQSVCFLTRSVVPKDRDPAKGIAVSGYPPNRWKRQMGGNELLTGLGQFGQEPDPYPLCFFGIMLEAIVPIGVIEADRKHCIASKCQLVLARPQPDHAMPRCVPACAGDNNSWRDLVFLVEQLKMAAILLGETLGRRPKRIRES